ncbi:uncharacterized protein [Amphiura filiformis]|uniref:uncharacterized protein n=1 Tax=Amphiura filiformis TaxID=82378 RepID=UPI003B216ECF
MLGNIKAYCWTLEEQKRSLKHIHLLAILQQPLTPEWVESVVWAFIPDPGTMPKLHKIVTQSMLHGPCGTFNPNSPCMINGQCKAKYPKDFCSTTTLSEDGFALYARPNDGTFHDKNGFRFDNRWVVPYNPWLLLKYNAHINTEVCGSVKNVKYLYKYITKGADMASVGIEKTEQQNTDEITNYVSSRWITASTATWSMFEFPTHGRHPPIVRLAVHEENQQTVIFKEGEEDIALDRNTNTTLTAWMKFNEDHPEARQHTYDQFPVHYRWDAANKRWLPRKTSNYCIARVYSTNPAQGERHYLRMLLHHIP